MISRWDFVVSMTYTVPDLKAFGFWKGGVVNYIMALSAGACPYFHMLLSLPWFHGWWSGVDGYCKAQYVCTAL